MLFFLFCFFRWLCERMRETTATVSIILLSISLSQIYFSLFCYISLSLVAFLCNNLRRSREAQEELQDGESYSETESAAWTSSTCFFNFIFISSIYWSLSKFILVHLRPLSIHLNTVMYSIESIFVSFLASDCFASSVRFFFRYGLLLLLLCICLMMKSTL